MSALVAIARRSWRQLTSMRTALVLLFLLAVAAVPGSVLPQRNIAVEKVNTYLREHPDAGPWLSRFGFFEVYASPWFSAIYLLLFLSLVGCLVPRLRGHASALLRQPPDAPKRLDRLPAYAGASAEPAEPTLAGAPGGPAGASAEPAEPTPAGAPGGTAEVLAEDADPADPAATAQRLKSLLKARRFRVAVRKQQGEITVSAEKGYLKETGNLLFHFALLALLIGVGFGSWYGWHGNRVLVAGADQAFCNTLLQWDERGLGARVDETDLPRFCVRLDEFQATYLDSGQPKAFDAAVTVKQGGREWAQHIRVNSPLRLDGANVYLLGHGYAPVLRYTDRYGQAQTTVAAFLPSDAMLTSDGVATFPDVNSNPQTGQRDPRSQVGFQGVYLPTTPAGPSLGRSAFPQERDPRLMLQPYQGELGFDAGAPLSVYTLDRRQIDAGRLKKFGEPLMLKVGEARTLPDGSRVEFLGTRQWISISIRHDPGEPVVLAGSAALLVGLVGSLTGKRRRIWFRICADGVTAGGLPRSDYPGFQAEFDEVVRSAELVRSAKLVRSAGAELPETKELAVPHVKER